MLPLLPPPSRLRPVVYLYRLLPLFVECGDAVVLQMLQLANTANGIVAAHFQIGFWTALGAMAMLCVLGVLAGLAPALRAMSIKPVDAMRDE